MLLSPVVRERIALSIDQVKHHLQADPDSAWGKEYTVHQDLFYMWHGAVKMFLQQPILGVGTGGYKTVLKKWVSRLETARKKSRGSIDSNSGMSWHLPLICLSKPFSRTPFPTVKAILIPCFRAIS